jgi:hypothetical protein
MAGKRRMCLRLLGSSSCCDYWAATGISLAQHAGSRRVWLATTLLLTIGPSRHGGTTVALRNDAICCGAAGIIDLLQVRTADIGAQLVACTAGSASVGRRPQVRHPYL